MEPILLNVAILFLLLFALGKGAAWAVRSAVALSRRAGLAEFVVSIVVVTAISILPETIISILSAIHGIPSLGLGTLLGSNVADLTLVFGVVALAARRKIGVELTFIKKDYLFLGFLLPPLILGFTGYFSRLDGILLVLASIIFFYIMLKAHPRKKERENGIYKISAAKEVLILAASLIVMGGSAYYGVDYAKDIAENIGISHALVGLIIVAAGTTLPELIFSIRAVRRRHASLALGDIFGTVITDANLVLGITALIHPFAFNPRLIIVTGIFMLLAGLLSLELLRSDRALTKSEGVLLLLFYVLFIMVEFILRDWTPLIPR
ncbi:MAG: K+dependent Na+ exchanger related-protein [Parcubacteria group bacterium Gr01-1014_33]|nr:MAG: K+dependent Na+ exchanger related-protein [Parcubacteria group bacterium Gr01-1014_33]